MEYDLLHKMFRQQAAATPEALAVVDSDGRRMTYQELDTATEILATNLRIKGVVPDSVVGIYMEKNIEYVISYIAILKAGGAYMPIDIAYPVTLLEEVLEDSQPVAVIADQDLLPKLTNAKCKLVLNKGWEERLKEENGRHPVFTEPPKVTLDSMAYTVYSSGTTGKPKGVQCPHRGAAFSYHYRNALYPYQPGDREACYIFFVWEMLRPLLYGCPMYIISNHDIYDPVQLCKFLKENEITRMLFSPSLLETVIETDGLDFTDSLKKMRQIIFCGEVVTSGLLNRCIKAFPHIQFLNLYSVSECHDVSYADLSKFHAEIESNGSSKKFCPVGQLLPGVSVVIMDLDLKPLPVGVPGEVYVGGPTLAIGYLNRPEINSLRFIQRPESVPASVGERLYKTGDWGYLLSDGSFEICGRCDSMVKIRGYSIESQAVEAAILELPMVNSCVVLVKGEEGEDKFLVAYIVPEGQTTKKEVRAALKRRLPFYMIPSYFIFLVNIPIHASSGKLDKKALPPISKEENIEQDAESIPTTESEKALAPIWCNVLGLDTIDIQESFFDLGGHSLLASKLLNKMAEALQIEMTVKDLFLNPTVYCMARFLDGKLHRENGEVKRAVTPVLDLEKEVERHDQGVINMDMQLRAFWRAAKHEGRWKNGRVLLTGGTGFLGTFLLRELLTQTKTTVFCLVRDSPTKNGRERLVDSMRQFGVIAQNAAVATEEQQKMEERLNARVVTIKGDVSLYNMGLTEEDYTYLQTEIDFIIHAAAYVNLIYPYQALYGPNVFGTENVVVFACTGKIKPLHYISTDAVFPHGLVNCPEDANMMTHHADLEDGYSQTKWVAEQLVLKASSRGLPAAIYRLGNQSGDSKSAHWNPQDFTLLMMKGCIQMGMAPELDWQMEFTPVDWTAKIIIKLTQNIMLSLGKIFHIMNPAPINSRWLFEWLNAHSFPLKMTPFDKWVEVIDSKGGKHPLQGVLDTIGRDASFFANLSTYRIDNLEKVMRTFEMSYPEINHNLLNTYVTNLIRHRVLPKPRRNTISDKPLHGQVAIVTGASSGIGAAIATHLCRAGAMVTLAARREGPLHELREKMEQEGGVAIAVKTDVTNRQSVEQMVQHTEATLGPVDILVNNAGVMYYTKMTNLMKDDWERQIDINCKGVMNGIGAVLDGMVKRKHGHIVNMSSDAGRKGFAGLAVYSGTKFFVEGMSQAMRQELAPTGVKVTCIQPGDVKTELLTHTNDAEARAMYDGSASHKILDPDDIGRAVFYAVTQPEHCAINEILIEPREAPA